MGSGPLLERPHKFFIDAAYQQISHLTLQKPNDIIDIISPPACQGRIFGVGSDRSGPRKDFR
jgi:hypothetical protein